MTVVPIVNLTDEQAGWGTISYGPPESPFVFSGLRTVSLNGEHQYDEAERAVIFTRYTLEIETYSFGSNASSSSTNLASIRRLLQQPGQTLTITGLGFGDLIVTGGQGTPLAITDDDDDGDEDGTDGEGDEPTASATTVADVDWGPKPRLTTFSPDGVVCWRFKWTCVFAIKECTSFATQNGGVLAFNYRVSTSYDSAGLCTRIISGYLQIAQTRTADGGTAVETSADSYRNQIMVAVPYGFRREPRVFELIESKNRLNFTIIDRQLDGAVLPENCLNADLEFEVENAPPGFARYVATLSGTIETPPGTPPAVAGQAFINVMLDRWRQLNNMFGEDTTIFPRRVRMGFPLFGRVSRFSWAWEITSTSCLGDLLTAGGIWAPLDISDADDEYIAWAESMAGVWGNTGAAPNLVYNAAEDAIVDLCAGFTPPVLGEGQEPSPGEEGDGETDFEFEISEAASWLAYENSLRTTQKQNSVEHKPAVPYNPTGSSASFSAGGDDSYADEVDEASNDPTEEVGIVMPMPVPEEDPSTWQYQGAPTQRVVMIGKCMRIGYQPAIPKLLTVGGQSVVEEKVVVDGPKSIACFMGLTVYTARWRITYRVDGGGYVGTNDDQPNPSLCCEESDDESPGEGGVSPGDLG